MKRKASKGYARKHAEVILSIAVYHPIRSTMRTQEFEVLGSQPLTALRDALHCPKDFVENRDRKNRDPEGAVLNTREKKMSGSCLFFEDVFYLDTRAEEVDGLGPEPDYSQ